MLPNALARGVPQADWVDPAQLLIDPYPIYARLRRESPVAWVPALKRFLVTRFDHCFNIELDQATYSSHEDAGRSTLVRTMGRPMLRKDDPEHKRDRNASASALRPVTIKRVWTEIFERNAQRYIERLKEIGPGADLFQQFAVPYAADNLSAILGLHDVPAQTMMDWSHTLIAGISNVLDQPAIWQGTQRVCGEIDEAVDRSVAILKRSPDASMLSAMIHAAEPIPDEALRANVRLTISGGMNEPSHVIASAVWALLNHPDQLADVLAGAFNWADVFEETARWQSPVGMYPRTLTRDVELDGVTLPAGSTLGIVVASANRDETRFAEAQRFDVRRQRVTNLAFGNGPHICAGNWAARAMISDVALPRLFAELPGLRLIDADAVTFHGWVFRGVVSLPVAWDLP
ncbi:cytochrome P450 [Pseudomonas sp. LRF_L74]|uniref:cytochrome P450 n=1 Tax=Pseudomonas sp. LRF_L74 TaxID=3369422 RepID=UPI003F5FE273